MAERPGALFFLAFLTSLATLALAMQDLCFLDLETTGFEPGKDSIIEISFVRYVDGELVQEVDQVCIPDKSQLTDFVSNLTGITQAEIDQEGILFADIASSVTEKIGESVIVGHNIDFDINFLVGNNVDVKNNPRIDTHELARILLVGEESYALEVLTQKYGFTHESAHRAMSDVLASKDLYEFLLQKIESLPAEYLQQIKPVLETKTDWHAKHLFLDAQGVSEFAREEDKELPSVPQQEVSFELPTPGLVQTLQIGDAQKSADFLSTIPGNFPNQKFVIVTPKLGFYPYFKQFPTPEVLFDPERFTKFIERQETLDNLEATFYLKCAYRHFLGHRGKQFFDIFTFKEPPLWEQVCADETVDVFRSICKEREDERVLVLTPYAFFRFQGLSIFSDRVLIFDEGEQCAESFFWAQSTTHSLQWCLDNPGISTETQFFVTDFCRSVIEEELQQNLSHFPTKMLLPRGRAYTRLAERLRELMPIEDAADILDHPETHPVRWVVYYPDGGNLTFHSWSEEFWEERKTALGRQPQIWTHRHRDPKRFLELFVGTENLHPISVPGLVPDYGITIPANLTSANSPDFNASCAQKICDVFAQKCPNAGDHLAVYVSSVEALRQLHEMIGERLKEEDAFVIGERASGGGGKVLELLKKNASKQGIFLFQKLLDPSLTRYNWKSVVIQKFPFLPPHPVFQDRILESQLGVNWWEDRVIPQVAGNLSRGISQFGTKNIILIDPRENAPWGKDLLYRTFGSAENRLSD